MLSGGFRVRAARRGGTSKDLSLCLSKDTLHPGLRQRITDDYQPVTGLALPVTSYLLIFRPGGVMVCNT